MKMKNDIVIKSLYFSNDEILDAIEKLYLPDGFECDVTYGNGSFYKNRNQPKYKFDIDPLFSDVIKCDSGNLDVIDNKFSSIMFDPPFLTYVKNGREHGTTKKSIMSSRFGGYWKYDELIVHYSRTIADAYRVLKKDGIFVVKCQDIIHNHSMHCTHQLVLNLAGEIGFDTEDLFILGAKHRIPIGKNKKQKHARIYHSYFLVFRKK